MVVLLPQALFRFSSLLLRIENPYTQWAWIANPDQRHGMEHPLGLANSTARTSAGSGPTARHEHPSGRVQLINTPIPPHIVNAIIGDQTIK